MLIESRGVRPFRVLLFGWMNLNVIDGSSFFMTSVAQSLTNDPLVHVDILLASPLRRTIVLEDIIHRHNVSVLDPFRDSRLAKFAGPRTFADSISYEQAASYLSYYASLADYDAILIRSTEVASIVATNYPELTPRSVFYVTGVTHSDRDIDEEVSRRLGAICDSEALLACQTPEMRERLLEEFPSVNPERIHVITPMVRHGDVPFEQIQKTPTDLLKIAYTGKFVDQWNPDRIIAGFKQAKFSEPNMRLDVAGDQFKHSPDNPRFVANTRYLLDNTDGVTWHGGLARTEARKLIEACDVGVSWRSSALNSSLELSTKLLEYGALGRPSIINRTQMHEKIFGKDYPLYVESSAEYTDLLVRIAREPSLIQLAARRAFEVSQHFSLEESYRRLMRTFAHLPSAHDRATPSLSFAPESAQVHGVTTERLNLAESDSPLADVVILLVRAPLVSYSFQGPVLTLYFGSEAGEGSRMIEDSLKSNAGRSLLSILFQREAYARDAYAVTTEVPTTESYARYADQENNRIISSLEYQLKNSRKPQVDSDIAALEARLEEVRARLDALRTSKLGRIQAWYWRRSRR